VEAVRALLAAHGGALGPMDENDADGGGEEEGETGLEEALGAAAI
jgi:hypothetical protein